MFEESSLAEPRSRISDWMLRGAIALVFVLFGAEKFPSDPDGPWVKLFQQIGFGQWFRSFTGIVEILGGLLVLIPWTSRAALALLAATMGFAALILDLVVRRPRDTASSRPASSSFSRPSGWLGAAGESSKNRTANRVKRNGNRD